MRRTPLVAALLCTLSLVGGAGRAGASDAVLLELREQAELSGVRTLRGADRTLAAYAELRRVAEKTQPSLLAELERRRIAAERFWIVNAVRIEADAHTRAWLRTRDEVARVIPDRPWRVELPDLQPAGPARAIEPSLQWIGVPTLWARGIRGQGVLIAGQDTGYLFTHPALIGSYRGYDGSNVAHDYHWFDGITSGGIATCPANSPEPCDDHGHGTHTMGTMVGDDGAGNQIGIAPAARWIGCRNMDRGVGTPSTYLRCMQFFLAPTDRAGNNPDPTRAPHVINNSWGCPPSEGCTVPDILRLAVEHLRAAGITFVVSAGNSGPACATVSDPPAIYQASFVVGASDLADQVAGFSARGPVQVDGSGRRKPDLVAPGVGIRSAVLGNGYGLASGTSMAGPHVAGVVALLMSADPSLKRDPERVEAILSASARRIGSTQTCGGIPPTEYPNHVVGHGRLDAAAAIDRLLPWFADGFEGPP